MRGFWTRRERKSSEDEGEDLLAASEAAEFEASVAAARARAVSRAVPTAPEPEPPDEIEWEERDDVYRPEQGDIGRILQSLFLSAETGDNPSAALIDKRSLAAIESHLHEDHTIELGGLLAGTVCHDAERNGYLVCVRAAIPAREGEGTATTFSYTSEAWASITTRLAELDPNWTIVGSYHSHPGMGVFLSATDLRTQEDVFSHPWQLAIVIDPIAHQTGVFIGPDGHPIGRWYTVDLKDAA